MYWPRHNTLIMADLHLGKSAHFRKAGIALPGKAATKDFKRLEGLLQSIGPGRVLILGDLFHSDYNAEWELFIRFVAAHPSVSFELVGGNHDILSMEHYEQAGLTVYPEEKQEGPFLYTHIPLALEEVPKGLVNLSGHLHPGVRLRGNGRQRLKLPCFFLNPQQGILPSFGSLTGQMAMKPNRNSQVYAIAADKVIDVSAST